MGLNWLIPATSWVPTMPAFRNLRPRPRARAGRALAAGIALALVTPALTCRAESSSSVGNPIEMELQDLMAVDLTVTSPARRAQRLAETPAAVFVLTGDDLRRAGVIGLPDALRLVPGIDVGQINANSWAITARGFNGIFANKLQVLIDGQSVYTPVYSGVFWNQHELLLDDIDRIEVIRGPAAALWGANAVNGAINIITKPAGQTQGALLTTMASGNELSSGARYGFAIGDQGYGRISSQWHRADAGRRPDGTTGDDDWAVERVDFRSDLTVGDGDSLTVLSRVIRNENGSTLTLPNLRQPFSRQSASDVDFVGGSIQSRWRRPFSAKSQVSVQMYYQHEQTTITETRDRRDYINGITDIVDIEGEYGFPLGQSHQFVIGTEIRHVGLETTPTDFYTNNNSKSSSDIFSAFVQDEISIIPAEVSLTLASRFEHNSLTGLEAQPTARLLWTPRSDFSGWTAVSRAVRTPSIVEFATERLFLAASAGTGQFAPPVALYNLGARTPASEEVVAYELGARYRPWSFLSLDVATFYSEYGNLQSGEAKTPVFSPSPVPHLEIPLVYENKLRGESYGAEVGAELAIDRNWRLSATYSLLDLSLWADADSTDTTSAAQKGRSPTHKATVRSAVDIDKSLDFDLTLRAVDRLDAASVPGYVELDGRVGWRPADGIELAVIGRNLLHSSHPEFRESATSLTNTLTERTIFGAVTLRF